MLSLDAIWPEVQTVSVWKSLNTTRNISEIKCLLIDILSIVSDTELEPEFLPSKILYSAPKPFFPEITEFRAHKLSR